MLHNAVPYGQEAFEFVEQIERLSDSDPVMDAMTLVLGRFGFDVIDIYRWLR